MIRYILSYTKSEMSSFFCGKFVFFVSFQHLVSAFFSSTTLCVAGAPSAPPLGDFRKSDRQCILSPAHAPCGSMHSIEFAQQIHKSCTSEFIQGKKKCARRARFFFSIRSKAWFRARGCSKNDSFLTASKRTLYASFFADRLFFTHSAIVCLTFFICSGFARWAFMPAARHFCASS